MDPICVAGSNEIPVGVRRQPALEESGQEMFEVERKIQMAKANESSEYNDATMRTTHSQGIVVVIVLHLFLHLLPGNRHRCPVTSRV